MKTFHRNPLLFIILAGISISLHAQPALDSLLQVVLINNLELQALRIEHQAELADLQSENMPNGPTVEYSPFYLHGYHGMASSELVVSQEFDFPTLYGQRGRQIRLENQRQDNEYELAAKRVALVTRLTCYEITRQNQHIEMLQERLRQNRRTTELLEKRMKAGDANALELNKARLEQMQAAQELVEVENERKQSLQQLQVLNGNIPVSWDERQFPELPPLPSNGYPTNLPELRLAESELSSSRHEETLARQSWLPSISVGYRRNTDESIRLNGFLVGASFPLWSTSSKQRAAHLRTESSQMRLEQVRQETISAQQMRHDELMRLHSILDHSDTKLLNETLNLLEKAMQHGQITSLQYYTECADIYEKLTKHIALHCRYVQLYAELYLR